MLQVVTEGINVLEGNHCAELNGGHFGQDKLRRCPKELRGFILFRFKYSPSLFFGIIMADMFICNMKSSLYSESYDMNSNLKIKR